MNFIKNYQGDMEMVMRVLMQKSLRAQKNRIKYKSDMEPTSWLNDYCTVHVKTGRQSGHTFGAKCIFDELGGVWITHNNNMLKNVKCMETMKHNGFDLMPSNKQYYTVNNEIVLHPDTKIVIIDVYSYVSKMKQFEKILKLITEHAYKQNQFVLLCIE